MTPIPAILRNGSRVEDRRLDRLQFQDKRSLNYPITSVLDADENKLRSYTWSCTVRLDQGNEGACVGFGWAAELSARPAIIDGITDDIAKKEIYWPAQKQDPWPGGSYPGADPVYEGTSVLAAAQVLRARGFMNEYRWAFSLKELALGVGYKGPAVIGVDWYQGMRDPDVRGFLHPTGEIVGGHCVVILGVKVVRKGTSIDHDNSFFMIQNSWGRDWGQDGRCKITFTEFVALLPGADLCIPVERQQATFG